MASTSLWLWPPGLGSDRTARAFRLRRRSWHGTSGSLSLLRAAGGGCARDQRPDHDAAAGECRTGKAGRALRALHGLLIWLSIGLGAMVLFDSNNASSPNFSIRVRAPARKRQTESPICTGCAWHCRTSAELRVPASRWRVGHHWRTVDPRAFKAGWLGVWARQSRIAAKSKKPATGRTGVPGRRDARMLLVSRDRPTRLSGEPPSQPSARLRPWPNRASLSAKKLPAPPQFRPRSARGTPAFP
jgi:hypothetical protein